MLVIRNATKDPEEYYNAENNRAGGLITIKLGNDKSYSFTPLAGAIILSLLALVFFAVISDLRTSMVLLNIWSILHSIVFIIVCVLCKMTRKSNENPVHEDVIDTEYDDKLTQTHPVY